MRASTMRALKLGPLPKLNIETRWGLVIIGLILAGGLFVPLLSPYDAYVSGNNLLAPPTLAHPFGTDNLGRDVFTRAFTAVRLDVGLALVGVSVPLLVGTFIGAVLGTTRSSLLAGVWITVIDGINAFPFVVLVLAIVAIVGPGVQGMLIGLAVTNWARYARIARSRALALRDADFIHAAQVLGYSRLRVLVNHVFPNVYSETLAYGLSDFVIVIIAIASLSFLGAGIRPPTPEWGAMMYEGRLYLGQQWWLTVFPGLVLSLTASGIAILAGGMVGQLRGEEF